MADIPYSEEEYADAATNNPHLKLAFRLVKFSLRDDGWSSPSPALTRHKANLSIPEADEYEWFVPSTVIPEELQRSLSVIDGFLANPIDLDGKSAADELNKKAKSRKRTRPPVNEGGDDDDLDGAERNLTKRKEKKQREDKLYKSHEMIEDSDFDDPEKDVEFYKKEKALRERAVTAADTGKPSLMLSTGTKKRKKSQSANIKVARRRKAPGQGRKQDDEDEEAAEGVSDDSLDVSAVFRPAVRPRRRVAPAPEPAGALSDMETPLDTTIEDDDDTRTELAPPVAPQPKPRRRNQVVISDEDE